MSNKPGRKALRCCLRKLLAKTRTSLANCRDRTSIAVRSALRVARVRRGDEKVQGLRGYDRRPRFLALNATKFDSGERKNEHDRR